MFRLTFICLFALVSMILAKNSCPCEVTTTDAAVNLNELNDNDYLDILTNPSESAEVAQLYPTLFRQAKSLEFARTRSKRPSWAAVGKRAVAFNNKQPSWAQVG